MDGKLHGRMCRGRPKKQFMKKIAEDVGARDYSKTKIVAWERKLRMLQIDTTNLRVEVY